MADNVTTGNTYTFATKDNSGVHHPKSVLQDMVSGTPTDISSANPLPVSDAGGSLTVDGTVTANLAPATSGGLTPHKTISAASTNSTNVKGSAGQLYEIVVSNINAAAAYLKLYDKATAPTVGTDTPVWTILVPGNTAGGGVAKTIPNGLAFANGIGFGLTTAVADASTAAVAANEVVVNLGYK